MSKSSRVDLRGVKVGDRLDASVELIYKEQVIDGLLSGLSLPRLAQNLGLELAEVKRLAREALEASDIFGDLVKTRLRMQLLRLDEAYRLVREEMARGNLQSVFAMARLMEREAKLLGLDAAEKRVVEHRLSPLEQFAKEVFGKGMIEDGNVIDVEWEEGAGDGKG